MATAPIEVQIKATGVDGVQRQIRLVRDETAAFNSVSEKGVEISHSAARGLGELGRGLGQVAQSGQLGAFSLREFTGAAFRLGAEFGPAGMGAAIGLTVLAIGTLIEVFGKAGDASKKMAEDFQRSLDEMMNAGDVAAMKKKAQDIWLGTPSDNFRNHTTLGQLQYQEQLLVDKMNDSGGLTHAALAKQLEQFRKDSHVDELTKQFNDLRQAIADVNNMPLTFGGLSAMHTTAKKDDNSVGEVPIPLAVQHALEEMKKQGYDPSGRGGELGVTLGLTRLQQNSAFGADFGKLLAGAHPKAADGAKVGDVFTVELPKAISVAQASVTNFFGEWGSMIDTLIQHHGKLGKAIIDTGKHALGQVMAAQGQATLLKAGQAAAEGLWPPDPGLLAKAAELLAIGTAEVAFGSALGGGGSSSYGGGGSSYGAGSAYATQSSLANARKKTTIVFKGGPTINLGDPQQRAEWIENLQELAGDGDLDFLFLS